MSSSGGKRVNRGNRPGGNRNKVNVGKAPSGSQRLATASKSKGPMTFNIDHQVNVMEKRYGIAIQGGKHAGPIIGREKSLLTAGQVRGFQAQQEIRTMRSAVSQKMGHDYLGGLNKTNDRLHSYTETIKSGSKAENQKLTGAAIQGHGLVHTAAKPGEVLLGSRGSKPYKHLADNNQVKTANIIGWNINRNDAFMAGAMSGPNRFTMPLQNPKKDYIDGSKRASSRPGRVTVREVAQLNQYAERPAPHPKIGIQAIYSKDRFTVARTTFAKPGVDSAGMKRVGDAAQKSPGPTYQGIPNIK